MFTVHCAWSAWNPWGSCSKTCDGGTHQRSRVIGAAPNYGGTNCTGDIIESGPCNTQICPGNEIIMAHYISITVLRFEISVLAIEYTHLIAFLVDCNWNIWGSWGFCTKTCGSGSRTRTRSKNGPFHGGIDCSGSLSESSSCNTNSCPGKYKLMNISLFKYINMCS